MGSQQPFGYDFAEGFDTRNESSGPPLLDAFDATLINNFFDNPDATLHNDDGGYKQSHNEEFTWPPTFHGASTESDPLRAMTDARSHNALGLNNDHTLSNAVPGATQQDVLAASALFNAHGLQVGSLYPTSSHHHHPSSAPNGSFSSPTDRNHNQHALASPASATSSASFHHPPHSHRPSLDHRSPSMPNMVFGFPAGGDVSSPQQAHPYSHHGSIDSSMGMQAIPGRADQRPRLGFGSDQSFGATGFQLAGTEQYERNLHNRLVTDHLSMVDPEALQRQLAENHRLQESNASDNRRFAGQHLDEFNAHTDSKSRNQFSDGPSTQSLKRRRNTQDADEDEDDEDTPKAKARATSKTKSSKEANGTSNAIKRRKSMPASINTNVRGGENTPEPSSAALAGSKNQRENLSEEQKRTNHIQSEQKRRNLIKDYFKQINELVPALRDSNGGAGSGNMSKNQILQETADYLDQLLADNETLRQLNGLSPDDPAGLG